MVYGSPSTRQKSFYCYNIVKNKVILSFDDDVNGNAPRWFFFECVRSLKRRTKSDNYYNDSDKPTINK